MGDNLKEVGAEGERVVRAHLESLGWRILTANFRCPAGEMDVIAEEPAPDGTVLVFLEVKTRRGQAHGTPVQAVDARKSRRLRAVARGFLAARAAGGEEPACRFDVAEVVRAENGRWRVRLHSGIDVGA